MVSALDHEKCDKRHDVRSMVVSFYTAFGECNACRLTRNFHLFAIRRTFRSGIMAVHHTELIFTCFKFRFSDESGLIETHNAISNSIAPRIFDNQAIVINGVESICCTEGGMRRTVYIAFQEFATKQIR